MLLGPDDPLPRIPQRIVVNGSAGAGKSTLAGRIAERLDLPYTEIDSLYHGPGWTVRTSFVEDVRAFAAGDRWVCEWQYDAVRPLLLDRCDLLVWLDVGRLVATWRVTRRTVRRRLRREVLWNGNREGPLWRVVTDREQIIRWAWSTHPSAATRISTLQRTRPDLPVVRLRTTAEVGRWVESLSAAGGRREPPR